MKESIDERDPMNYKNVVMLEGDKRRNIGFVTVNTLILSQVAEQLHKGITKDIKISVGITEWFVDAEITPMEIILHAKSKKLNNGVVVMYDHYL